jgi:hypothetical protein
MFPRLPSNNNPKAWNCYTFYTKPYDFDDPSSWVCESFHNHEDMIRWVNSLNRKVLHIEEYQSGYFKVLVTTKGFWEKFGYESESRLW